MGYRTFLEICTVQSLEKPQIIYTIHIQTDESIDFACVTSLYGFYKNLIHFLKALYSGLGHGNTPYSPVKKKVHPSEFYSNLR